MDAVLITAVNGTAAGAGFSIAVTGDLVLAAESASFTMAYTRVGLSPDGSSSYFLPRLIGITKTKELMLTNRTLSAAGGVAVGTGDRGGARRRAGRQDRSAGRPNGGHRKRIQRWSQGSDVVDILQRPRGADGIRRSTSSPNVRESADGREGVDAFLAKRKPEFA